ncbi:MAG TPA: J domain-containing protein [Candidatus Saccharimonadales bacterium]
MPLFTIRNGDTDEYSIFEWEVFSPSGKKIKGLFDVLIDKQSRNWSVPRKCWFVHNSVVEPFIAGMKVLFTTDREFASWSVKDLRVKLESFDEFFETPAPMAKTPRTKAELIKSFEHLLKSNEIYISIREDIDLDSGKKIYRKGALALHPDRNNGDGSKMAELNILWAELQPLLK